MVDGTAENAAQATPPPPPPEPDSLRDSFARLISSCREMADAELTWAKLKARMITAAISRAAILGFVALVLVVVALALLVVAAVIALAPAVGWLAATLIVAAVCVVIAAVLGLAARKAVSGIFRTER